MRRTPFSVEQITSVLQQVTAGMAVRRLAPGRNLRADVLSLEEDYGGMLPSEARELEQLRDDNVKRKRLVADLSIDKAMLQDVVSKKF